MARLLRIENCCQCTRCRYVPETVGMRSHRICDATHGRHMFEHGYDIPGWCPLPEAEEATDADR
jgi:hypothetical protein